VEQKNSGNVLLATYLFEDQEYIMAQKTILESKIQQLVRGGSEERDQGQCKAM
jgi:hypothetical protein